MADNVRFILDKLAALFRRLEDTELFSKDEVKSIVKKVTDSEYVLKRRHLETSDFQSYLKYTLALDKLLGARVKTVSEKAEKLSKDVHDMLHAIQKTLDNHIIYIFDRSVRRFPEEVTLWNDYIAFLQRKDATTQLNAVFGKALSLYPKNEQFWLQASIHELEANSNVHSARITLQRGLRANPTSSKLWLRYFELELWNALRATERQKALEIQENYEALQGAPMVVFRHALAAITDIDAVLEIYSACETVGGDFAASLRTVLIDKHGDKPEIWQHLALAALSNMHATLEMSQEATGAEGSTAESAQPSKGKRKAATTSESASAEEAKRADVTVGEAAKALAQCAAVLEEGRAHISNGGNGSDVCTVADVLRTYSIMAVRTLHRAVRDIAAVCRAIPQTAWDAWANSLTQIPASEVDAATAGTPAAKRKKGAKKTDTTATDGAAATSSVSNNSAAALAQALQALLQTSSAVATSDGVSALSCLHRALGHSVHQLCEIFLRGGAIPAVQAVQGSETAISTAQLATWCAASAPALVKSSTRVGATKAGTDTTTEIVDAYVLCVEAVLDALEGGHEVAAVKLQVLTSLLRCTIALVASPTGSSTAQRLLHVTYALVTAQVHPAAADKVVSTLRTVVTDTAITVTTAARAQWCIFYVTLLEADDAAEASVRLSALQSAYTWVEGAIKSKPHLFHGPQMQDFYTHVLEAAQACLSSTAAVLSSGDDRKVLDFVQSVAESALVACPKEAAFWTALEQVQQRKGELKAATHTRWRRDKALSSA